MQIFDMLSCVYSDALTEVVSTVAGIRLKVVSRESDKEFNDIIGVMILNGDESGILSVSANKPDARILCANIIGISPADVTEDDMDDTMCELVNMTAGNSKLRLSDSSYMFTLSQPFVIKGKDVSIVTKNITNVIASTLSDGEITVKIKAIY